MSEPQSRAPQARPIHQAVSWIEPDLSVHLGFKSGPAAESICESIKPKPLHDSRWDMKGFSSLFYTVFGVIVGAIAPAQRSTSSAPRDPMEPFPAVRHAHTYPQAGGAVGSAWRGGGARPLLISKTIPEREAGLALRDVLARRALGQARARIRRQWTPNRMRNAFIYIASQALAAILMLIFVASRVRWGDGFQRKCHRTQEMRTPREVSFSSTIWES